MRIDSSGRVMIGTTTEGETGGDQFTVAGSGNTGITIRGGTTSDTNIFFSDGTSGSDEFRGIIRYQHNSNQFEFFTDASRRMVIDSSGNLGIGTTSPSSTLDVNGDITISSSHPRIFFTDSNGNPDYLIDVNGGHFLIHDVTNAADRFKIDSSGNVGIGVTSVSSKLHLDSGGATTSIQIDSDTESSINFNDHGGSPKSYKIGTNISENSSQFEITDNSASHMRLAIFSDGDAFLGGAAGADVTANSNSKGFVYDNDTASAGDAGGNHPFICIQHATKTTGAAAYINFQSQTSTRGSIVESNSGNNVTYNTSSDYRLKQDERDITDGITRLKQLKPYQFKWKDDLDYGYVDGFFAHEVGEVVKGATTGTKDEVVTQSGIDDGTYKGGAKVGDLVPQGLDYARITPLLTAALKEAVTKIELLETKVAALEAA
tara:strand:+ start:1 stop:1293 length:1293 start_codon:yes stop_codon:yes gene_type:complete